MTALQPILRTEKLVKIYGGRAVVNGVELAIKPGEVVGVLGPNGAGKTTTFYMVVGLVRPNGGRVIFKDQDVTDFPMHRRARMGMGYLPQEESIFRKLTVEENILAILETTGTTKLERGITGAVRHRTCGQTAGTDVERRREAAADHRPLAGEQPEPADVGRAVQRRRSHRRV